eukprot:gene6314-6963_t
MEPVKDISKLNFTEAVKVFHFIIGHWGESFHGVVPCQTTYCEFVISDHVKHLRNNFLYSTDHRLFGLPLTTLSLYNIHSVWERTRDPRPMICELPTNFTMAETEESWVRYSSLFDAAVKHFDAFSSTHPKASQVQRVYKEAYINEQEFLPMWNFSSLVKGASYIASDCHRRDTANANRDNVVLEIRNLGFRVDGLGRCMHTPTGPEGYTLPRSRDTRYNLHLKRQVIGRYMFNLAFENSIEDGYVTEKPFDALQSGTVPIYLGDPNQLKALLPHPKAAIFVADYPDRASLVQYLQLLVENETAYEEHRAWRKDFSYSTNLIGKPLLEKNWYCRVCQWAARESEKVTTTPALQEQYNHSIQIHDRHYRLSSRHSHCHSQDLPGGGGEEVKKKEPIPSHLEGQAVRFRHSKQIFLGKKGQLHAIPDMQTFLGLNLDVAKVVLLESADAERYVVGEPEPHLA